MADFTSTAGNDDFRATSAPDRFFFGENQGVDLIVGFNPSQDKLFYTDRSVDGFDDLGISQLSNGDTAVESNDQVTVLAGIRPEQLRDMNFVFTTSGPRGNISDARDNNDVPSEVSVRDINQREARLNGGGSGNPGGGTVPGGGNSGGNGGGGLADLLRRSGLGSALNDLLRRQFATNGGRALADGSDQTGFRQTMSGFASFPSTGQAGDYFGILPGGQHNLLRG